MAHGMAGVIGRVTLDAGKAAYIVPHRIDLPGVETTVAVGVGCWRKKQCRFIKNPVEYEWSSCRYNTIKRKGPEWLHREFILSYFEKKPSAAMKKYSVFVESIMDEEYKSPLSERLHSVILGSQDFIDEIKAGFLKKWNKRIGRLPGKPSCSFEDGR
jgi:hypothetical protein